MTDSKYFESVLRNLTLGQSDLSKIDPTLISECLKKFNKLGRPEIGKEISRSASILISRHGQEIIKKIGLFQTIYDLSAYLRWKTLDDLNTTAIEILESTILPTKKLFDLNFQNGRQKTKARRVGFVPSTKLFPTQPSNANVTGALGLVDSFVEAKKSDTNDAELIIFHPIISQIDMIDASKKYNNIKYFTSFQDLVIKINESKLDYIVQDYFCFFQLYLAYNIKNIPFVHLDPGFLPFMISPVKKIIALPAQRIFGRTLDPSGRLIRYLDRPLANEKNLSPRLERREITKLTFVFGALGRAEKIKNAYVNFIIEILDVYPKSKFSWAGARSDNIKKLFPEKYHDRIIIYGLMHAGKFLQTLDVFIETFPENQGYAVLDAFCMGVPVVSFDQLGTNANLSERLANMVVSTSEEALTIIDHLVKYKAFYGEIVVKQDRLLANFPTKADYCQNFLNNLDK